MPVEKNIGTPPRQIVFLIISTVLGIGSMAYVFSQISSDGADADYLRELGSSIFVVGPSDAIAEGIEESGPFLFSDLSGNSRDVWIQHVGDDDATGWTAFSVRSVDATRECSTIWEPAAEEFVDSCDGTTYPATGEGLTQYDLSLDGNGVLLLDLG